MRIRVLAALFYLPSVYAQSLLRGPEPGSTALLFPTDEAVLLDTELQTDLPCTTRPVTPELGFDLAYHAGYHVIIPLRALAGTGNTLKIIFRVTPEGPGNEPVYFSQTWSVPVLEEGSKGNADLEGGFLLGEGNYRIDWLIRDKSDRFCSAHWTMSAASRGKDRQIQLRVSPGTVTPAGDELFAAEEPVERDSEHPLRALIFLNVAPQSAGAATFGDDERAVLLSVLRSIAREPRIAAYSLIAFNAEKRLVLHRSSQAAQIDLPALGQALADTRIGAVPAETLQHRPDGATFLTTLVSSAVVSEEPDLILFVGAKNGLSDASFRASWDRLGEPRCAVIYLNYELMSSVFDRIHPNPWRDMISSLVRYWKGTEYTVSKPRDSFLIWATVMSRIPNGKALSGAVRQAP